MAGWNEPPKSTTTNTPLSEVGVSGDATPRKLQGGPEFTDAQGNVLSPVATYTPDGNDLVQGQTTDVAVSGDVAGTVSAKLRYLAKVFASIWDSANGRLKVDGSQVTQPVQYANVDVTALASAARTTTQTVDNLLNKVGRGIRVTLDMTVVGTGSVTLTINAKDAVSGKVKLLLAGAAVTTNVTNVYIVYPGYAVAANVSANDVLPATFQLVVTANNANSATYSLGYCILL